MALPSTLRSCVSKHVFGPRSRPPVPMPPVATMSPKARGFLGDREFLGGRSREEFVEALDREVVRLYSVVLLRA